MKSCLLIFSTIFFMLFTSMFGTVQAADQQGFVISVSVPSSLSFGTWCKRMTGDQDPGIQGVKHSSTNLAFDKLEWSPTAGSFQQPKNKWYAIFLSMEAPEAYKLSVQTSTTGNDDVDKGIVITFDSAIPDGVNGGDYYTDIFGNKIGDQSPLQAGKENVPSAKKNYANAVNSLYELKTKKVVYSNSVPDVNRIIRCYVSVFSYFNEFNPEHAGKNEILGIGSGTDPKPNINPIVKGSGLNSTSGSITFTMAPA